MNNKQVKHGSFSGILPLLLVLMGLMTFSVSAQNLLEDNPHARRARELRVLAERAIEQGEYEQSLEYTREADRERILAEEWAEMRVWAFRANSMRNRAREQMVYADRIDAKTHYPEEFELASTTMESAQRAFEDERYEESFEQFRLVRDTISPLQPVRVRAEERQEMITTPIEREERPATPSDAPVLPRYYVVRRIPGDRDSFNKIAGYEFVYGDRTRWRPLYEANRHMLQDPDNPHLIQPGMRFEIPSLDGEERSGVWQPED